MNRSQIMVVEDEPIVALDIETTLKSFQYSVIPGVASGDEAVRKAGQLRPDLILMDIRLKGTLDGVGAATQIRENFDIPVIYLTANADESTLQRAKTTEPFGYMLKPFDKKELHSTIEMALYKHRMEKKLRTSEQWLSTILKSAAEAVVTTDAEGRVTFMNPEAEWLTKWKIKEALGRDWREGFKIADESTQALSQHVAGVFREGGPLAALPNHTALVLRDGSHIPIAGSVAPIRSEKNRLAGVVMVFRDITERKQLEVKLLQANELLEKRVQDRTEEISRTNRELIREIEERQNTERKLRESEMKFRSIAESASESIVLADQAGMVLYVNKSAQAMFSIFAEEIVSRHIRSLVAEPARPALEKLFHELEQTPRPMAHGKVMEIAGLDKQDRTFPMEISLSKWETGGKRLYAALMRDISERKRAESHLKFQAGILSQVTDAVLAVDASRQVLYWNTGAERLYGCKTVDAMTRPLGEVVPAFWPSTAQAAAANDGLAASGFWHGEMPQQRKDGATLQVELTVSALKDDDGNGLGQLFVVRDVTERKNLQDMLIQSEKLAAMGQMAAAVSHELKAPLSVIFGFADVMLQQLKQGRDVTHPLDIIKRQVTRCANLVTGLLDFSRKKIPAETAEFDVRESLEEALPLIQPHALDKSVRIAQKWAEAPLRIIGNKDMLSQVVINLCLNAIDAMPDGGLLTLGARAAAGEEGASALITVSDTGTGIPEAIRQKIFDPFFTTKENGKGTGLGLWLVREIVTNLGGKIDCASEEGKGTDFTVTLPLAGAVAQPAESPPPAGPADQGGTAS